MLNRELTNARSLVVPSREATLYRAIAVEDFWQKNRLSLIQAWTEWEQTEGAELAQLDESLINKDLERALNQAWHNPSKEDEVKKLWEPVAQGVFKAQVFDPEKLNALRDYMDAAMNAKIPIKQPYGIVLNRNGAMLDKRTNGYLAAPAFERFYRMFLDKYIRPISRLLFPEVTGYDTQTFGFSMQYEPHKDTSIRSHTDASAVTFNVNINRLDELFSGSQVDFFDRTSNSVKSLTFEPGVAVIHRGMIPHAAHPITSGKRTNWVLWLYGDNGYVPFRETRQKAITASDRWKVPSNKLDGSAPF
ncbi:MAG: hypothetical protein ACKVJE_17880 [Pseudomonadales bacterium]